MKYAEILGKKMKQHGSKAYLVNTGWIGGGYGVGHRIDIRQTRNIITAILEGYIEKAETEEYPIFGFRIPKSIPEVDSNILNPRNTWADKNAYDEMAKKLAGMFINNFQKFTDDPEAKKLIAAGPKL